MTYGKRFSGKTGKVASGLEKELQQTLSREWREFPEDYEFFLKNDFREISSYAEKKAACAALASDAVSFFEVAGNPEDYEALVSQELDMIRGRCRLDGGGRAVFAGSGALPVSAVLIAEKTGMHVTCLDLDPEASCLAAIILGKFCPGLPVECRVADATGFDYSGCDVVFIANMAEPKEAILRRIRETAGSIPVITRTPEKKFETFYNILSEESIGICGYSVAERRGGEEVLHRSMCLLPCSEG